MVVADQRMPRMTGTEMLAQARAHAPDAKFLLLTAYADTDVAITAINDIRPSQQAMTGASGVPGPPAEAASRTAVWRWSRSPAQAAGHRDGLGRPDDEEAVERGLAPSAAAAGDDPERHARIACGVTATPMWTPRGATRAPATARNRAGE